MRLCVNSKAMQVKVQREKESCNGTMKENHNSPGLVSHLLPPLLHYPSIFWHADKAHLWIWHQRYLRIGERLTHSFLYIFLQHTQTHGDDGHLHALPEVLF